jgi:2-iminobutanoate/2-iminopropanoate deaminase
MKEIIKTETAPQAIGPYSQAIKIQCGQLLFCSGQIPLDPKTMQVVGKTAGEQCQQVMDNITNLLKVSGADWSNVVKTTIFLTDMGDFGPVNDMYSTYVGVNPPARSTVQVGRLPKDVKVEIEVIASL